jgi:ABC-type multidrug transport system fused ATPase/permease subunit
VFAETAPLKLSEVIRFENVSYAYPFAGRRAVEDLTFEIRAGTTIGVVGPTGAGKTTVIDLLIGLLAPTAGRILVDGRPIGDSNRRAWQRAIGYVPQATFLADLSVAENIAFGVKPDAIDMGAVERAAGIANIHEFVSGDLPSGYQTRIGERGVRLSGGQRQRIAIARALYHRPSVLVFDEATSSLDTDTEEAIIEAIGKLRRRHTIVMIAHRLTTVQDCDRILVMDNGRLVNTGTYHGLFRQEGRHSALAG